MASRIGSMAPSSMRAGLSPIHRVLSTLPNIPEPELPSPCDAYMDRTGAIDNRNDPFMSRKLQGKHGSYRGLDVVPMWIAVMSCWDY